MCIRDRSIPYGDSEKYDMIVDINGQLYRLQCKHANPHMNDCLLYTSSIIEVHLIMI